MADLHALVTSSHFTDGETGAQRGDAAARGAQLVGGTDTIQTPAASFSSLCSLHPVLYYLIIDCRPALAGWSTCIILLNLYTAR